MYFDTLKLSMAQECDRQTDGRTDIQREWFLANNTVVIDTR